MDHMLKDKPVTYVPSQSKGRWVRTCILSTIAALSLIYYFTLSTHSTGKGIDIRPGHGEKIDWSQYAYTQYATDQDYLCNSIMIFDSLENLGSKADRLLFYPKTWDLDVASSRDRTSQLLVLARDKYKVKLRPTEMYKLARSASDDDNSETTWDASINKLHAFRQGEYKRIIHVDSDILLFQHLDELFFLPSATVAMPRAYWKLDEPAHPGSGSSKLTSLVVVLQPSEDEANELWDLAAGFDNATVPSESAFESNNDTDTNNLVFDMEILNQRYKNTALVLPHRSYALVTGEFRRPGKHNHTRYLGNTHETWDPHRALKEAKLIHFSDWPVPKPWIATPTLLLREMQPVCEVASGTINEKGCNDRQIWKALYEQFRKKRRDVCRLLSVPAPEWPPRPRSRAGKKGGSGS